MGRRSGSCGTRGGRISKSIRNRSRGRGTAAGPFSSQPSGPWPVGCFSSAAADHSLRINSDMLVLSASAARTALKNSQLTDGESHVSMGQDTSRPCVRRRSGFRSLCGGIYMKRFFALLMIAAAVPCASVRADDQGPVEKTTNTVKKAAHETSNAVVNGAKTTGTTVSNGAKATGSAVSNRAKATRTNRRERPAEGG